VEAAVPLTPAPAAEKKPSFGTASVVCAGLTVLVPVLIMVFAGTRADRDTSDPSHVWGPLAILVAGGILAVLAAGVTSAVGAVTGGIALARGERNRWLAVIGLIVNAPVALFVLYLVTAVRANSGG
jgi:hypothetical protein